ncbi:uncharacterized protein qrfp [Trichomycterus rosablanca]|uniref:uncharacterized protein qrfp n=1 Tax=Trichomycterus rosablanca TaxID=2290929 RepID=UPI002F3590F0
MVTSLFRVRRQNEFKRDMNLQPSHICWSLLMPVLFLFPGGGLMFPRHPGISSWEAALLEAWMAEPLEKTELAELGRRALEPFVKHPMETMHYERGGGVEDVGEGDVKRNEALTSIAGGLQAFNRQKGGFGFRFGRK